MSLKIYINGKLYDKENAVVSVYDHGLLYGDGVFEGIRSYGGKVFRLKEHLDRLWYSAKAIRLEIPMTREELAKAIVDTLAVNGIRTATSAWWSPAAWHPGARSQRCSTAGDRDHGPHLPYRGTVPRD